jgi:hypothetical protein
MANRRFVAAHFTHFFWMRLLRTCHVLGRQSCWRKTAQRQRRLQLWCVGSKLGASGICLHFGHNHRNDYDMPTHFG